MRSYVRSVTILSAITLLLTQSAPVLAGFGFGGFNIPNSGSDLINFGKKKGEEAVLDQLSEQLGQKSPIYLNAHHAFKEVKAPNNFNPKKIEIRSIKDLVQKRPPGDYWINTVAYCTNRSVHNPGQGLPYTIGMTEGSQTQAISNLTLRGEIVGVNRGIIQNISTAIQAGVRPSEMDRTKRAIIDLIIPEFKQQLEQNGDVYNQYQHTYEDFQSKLPARLPYSFDQVVSKIPLGQQIVEAKRIHDIFTKHLDANEQGDNLYRQLGDGTPETLTTNHPQKSPWVQIRDNVIARATVINGRAGDGSDGINHLEFRILSNSVQGKALKEEKLALAPLEGMISVFLLNNYTQVTALKEKKVALFPIIVVEGVISVFEILGEALTAETVASGVSAAEGTAAANTIIADGVIAGSEVDIATVAGRAAQARRLTVKSSDILYGLGRAVQALTMAPAFEPNQGNRKDESELSPEQERTREEGKDKVPQEWGDGNPSKGSGWRWQDPENKGNNIRIESAKPDSQYPSQQQDYVKISSGGKVIGQDGNPIESTPEFQKLSDNPNSHIPLSTWRTWRTWNHP